MAAPKTKTQKVPQVVVSDWNEVGLGHWIRTYQGSNIVAADVSLQGSKMTGGRKWCWKVVALGSDVAADQGKETDLRVAKSAADKGLTGLLQA
jgi:hypothetical protein